MNKKILAGILSVVFVVLILYFTPQQKTEETTSVTSTITINIQTSEPHVETLTAYKYALYAILQTNDFTTQIPPQVSNVFRIMISYSSSPRLNIDTITYGNNEVLSLAPVSGLDVYGFAAYYALKYGASTASFFVNGNIVFFVSSGSVFLYWFTVPLSFYVSAVAHEGTLYVFRDTTFSSIRLTGTGTRCFVRLVDKSRGLVIYNNQPDAMCFCKGEKSSVILLPKYYVSSTYIFIYSGKVFTLPVPISNQAVYTFKSFTITFEK